MVTSACNRKGEMISTAGGNPGFWDQGCTYIIHWRINALKSAFSLRCCTCAAALLDLKKIKHFSCLTMSRKSQWQLCSVLHSNMNAYITVLSSLLPWRCFCFGTGKQCALCTGLNHTNTSPVSSLDSLDTRNVTCLQSEWVFSLLVRKICWDVANFWHYLFTV